MSGFFIDRLAESDPQVFNAIGKELVRQQDQIELIASENIVSRAVIDAQGSVLTNKYAEGYPGKRYYGGCEYVDIIEDLARERAAKLFNCSYVNVQPNSGSQANQAAFLALIKPGDTVLGMDLAAGGHLTHGSHVNQSGKWFNAVGYGVRRDNCLLDYEEVERLALEHKPKLIIAGGSGYSRIVDFAAFRAIADKVGAYLMVDMAHFAGLVAAGLYPNPLNWADVVTSTTHKTLRGPRGGLILSQSKDLGKKLDKSVFPGMQGGPLMHVIAGKAVAFAEALTPEFKTYAQSVIDNADILAKTLIEHDLNVVSGGTETHLMLVDLRGYGLHGRDVANTLELAGMTCNKNAIPFDPAKPVLTSGIRLGSAAATSRGFGQKEFQQIGHWVVTVLKAMLENNDTKLSETINNVRAQISDLCKKFPIYPEV